jgi:hypothetical protein
MSDIVDGVKSQVERVSTLFDRARPGPMLVRAIVLVAACGAFALALPANVIGSPAAILFVFVAILPAAAPRGPIPTGIIALLGVSWLVNTGFDGAQINLWRLSGLAILIYVIHAGCAFAAVLPYDSLVSPGVFRPWAIRAGLVAVMTFGVALFVLAIPSLIGTNHHLIAATLAGFVLMITIAIYLSYLGNRRQ